MMAHPSVSGVNGSMTNGSSQPGRMPLIPPSRNPPQAPSPTATHCIPLSVMPNDKHWKKFS